MAKYIITKQIAVEAESPEDAVSKIGEGKTISFQVIERPEQGGMLPGGRMPLTPAPVKQ